MAYVFFKTVGPRSTYRPLLKIVPSKPVQWLLLHGGDNGQLWTSTRRLLLSLMRPRFLARLIPLHILPKCSMATHLCKGPCQHFSGVLSVFIAKTSSLLMKMLLTISFLSLPGSSAVARFVKAALAASFPFICRAILLAGLMRSSRCQLRQPQIQRCCSSNGRAWFLSRPRTPELQTSY